MGFELQLRLLLWKNYTLKKRAPVSVWELYRLKVRRAVFCSCRDTMHVHLAYLANSRIFNSRNRIFLKC